MTEMKTQLTLIQKEVTQQKSQQKQKESPQQETQQPQEEQKLKNKKTCQLETCQKHNHAQNQTQNRKQSKTQNKNDKDRDGLPRRIAIRRCSMPGCHNMMNHCFTGEFLLLCSENCENMLQQLVQEGKYTT